VYISGMDTWGHISVASRSDVNILAAVNPQTKQILLVSTPRDYYVPLSISGGAKDKLTHAGIYGIDVSEDTMEMLYDVDIDYYFKLNFSGFEGLIDAMGGITVWSDYDFTVDPIKHYVVGENQLTGLEALAFARERHAFAGGDRQRGTNQMNVIQSVIDKMCSK
jgi:LCP family protein required for cell wall assembly